MAPPEVVTVARSQRRALRELLLAATASTGRAVADPRLGDLAASAPITLLPDLAKLHRVSGCVHSALCDLPGVPREVIEALAAARRRDLLSHLAFSRALAQLGAAWNAAGVPWLVMKGPVLTSVLYRDPGFRSYGDLDLLVAQASLADAVAVMEGLGYEHVIKNWPLARWYVASEFVMRRGTIEVDLHWHLVYAHYDRRYLSVVPHQMMERARTVAVAGQAVPTFDREDTLLHLALHATRSGAHRLIWLKDIERSLAVEHPDVEELVRRARAFHCAPAVGVALARAKTLLGADVRDDVVESLLGRTLARVERGATRLSSPIGFDEDDTLARFVARSMRSDVRTTVADLARRSVRSVRRAIPRRPHETADALEKQAFLDAVAGGHPPR
jgi:Uncharacterised nucleotidyltransferase